MKTIYKYQLEITDCQTIDMPLGAKLLCVDHQFGSLFIWAEVDPNHPMIPRQFDIYGTGSLIPEMCQEESRVYVGTVQIGGFVWHVYEEIQR